LTLSMAVAGVGEHLVGRQLDTLQKGSINS
jgi:hypothetical protein